MKWNFVDKDSAVVIQSMDHHGPSFYIKYNLTTGGELGRIDAFTPDDQLPDWARSFSK